VAQVIRTLVVLATLYAASSAAAQSVAIVPPLAGDGVQVAEVHRAAAEWLAQHDRRVVAMDSQLTRELEPCLTVLETMPPSCAFDYFKRSQADQALVTWVERDRAVVAIVIAPGLYYSGHARDTSWRQALDQALADARRREVRGLGPWLEVSGFPGDARVLVDGQEVGRLRGSAVRLSEGGHQVEVRAEGYEPRYELVNLPSATSYAALHVELVTRSQGLQASRATGEATGNTSPGSGASKHPPAWRAPTLIVAGGAATLLGVALLGRGIRAASRDDSATAELVAGSIATVAGVLLLSTGVKLHATASRESASLYLTKTF
jgi:hypothetical protein